MDPLVTSLLFGIFVGFVVGVMVVAGKGLEQVKTHDLTIVSGQAAWVERRVEDDRTISV